MPYLYIFAGDFAAEEAAHLQQTGISGVRDEGGDGKRVEYIEDPVYGRLVSAESCSLRVSSVTLRITSRFAKVAFVHYAQTVDYTNAPIKSSGVAYVLWLLTGIFAGHRCYLGTSDALIRALTLNYLVFGWLLDVCLIGDLVFEANQTIIKAARDAAVSNARENSRSMSPTS